MKNRLHAGLPVTLLMGLTCINPASAQGISEYASVMPGKAIPNPHALAGPLGKIYGTSSNNLNRMSGNVNARSQTQAANQIITPAQKSKSTKPIKSGDLPGEAKAALREQVLTMSKEASESYQKGLQAKKAGNMKEAAQWLKRSIAIRETYWADKDKLIPEILTDLAQVKCANQDDKGASEDLNKALAYYGKFHGPGSDHRIKPLLLLSDVDKRLGDMPSSYECYKQAFMLAERARLPEYNTVEMRLKAAKMAIDVEKYRESLEMFEKAVSSEERSKLSEDQLTDALDDYAVALKALNRNHDADAVLAEAEELRKKNKR